MDGPRSIASNEMDQLLKFLDKELRPESEWSIRDEYPTTFNPKNAHNLFIIEEEDQVLSHAAIRYVLLKTPQAVFKIGVIGSVVTDPQHRNQGHSHRLLQICLEKIRSEGADLAILWSDLISFYNKLGFHLCGTEVSVMIDDYLPVSSTDLIFREGANVSPEAILKVYSKHSVSSVRTLEEIRQYLKIPHARVYTAWSKTGTLEAFCVEGKGADLQGYIHEWGGSVSTLLPLLNFVRKHHEGRLTLISPVHSKNLLQKFKEMNVPMHEGQLGLVKILDHKTLIQKVQRHARSIGCSNLIFTSEEEKFLIGIDNSIAAIPSEDLLNILLFGPIPEAFWSNFSEEKQEVLKKIFPLNLWVWGWDSI